MFASHHHDSTPDSKRLVLCVYDYRGFRTAHAALQTAIDQVTSPELAR